MEEEWRSVEGFEPYQVSSLGRVKGIKGNVLRPQRRKTKYNRSMGYYMSVTLCTNGVKLPSLVHRLVARAFIPNPNNKAQVNHKNGRKDDNRLSNLEWVTAKENTQHAVQSGIAPAERNVKLGKSAVLFIRGVPMDIASHAYLANVFSVSKTTIAEVRSFKTWKGLV